MRVTLEDFQILKGKNIFEFPEGITVIVGPNASGKSSTFYAIQNALLNTSGVSECINHNAKQTKVTIENNNNSVTWVRTPTSSMYINNKTGEEFIKASKLTSQDIADLGFYFDNKGKIVNIHDEWSKLFPYGESDSDMFRLFEDIFNISCSFQVIDNIKGDEKTLSNSIRECQNTLTDLTTKQTTLLNIKKAVDKDKLDKSINDIKNSFDYCNELKATLDCYLKEKIKANIKVLAPYDISILQTFENNLNIISEEYKKYVENKKRLQINIKPINTEINLSDNTELKNDYFIYSNKLKEINTMNNELLELSTKINELQSQLNKIAVCPTCGRPLEE